MYAVALLLIGSSHHVFAAAACCLLLGTSQFRRNLATFLATARGFLHAR
jgi:hypothetical protein